MTLKALTVIMLRLYAVMYLIQTGFALVLYIPSIGAKDWIFLLLYPGVVLVLSVVLWLVARYLAALATKGIDGALPFSALTREDIYCCGFVIMGLNFFLSAIGSTLVELSQLIRCCAVGATFGNNNNPFTVPLVRHALTIIAGLACILGAQAWTRKLLRLEQKNPS